MAQLGSLVRKKCREWMMKIEGQTVETAVTCLKPSGTATGSVVTTRPKERKSQIKSRCTSNSRVKAADESEVQGRDGDKSRSRMNKKRRDISRIADQEKNARKVRDKNRLVNKMFKQSKTLKQTNCLDKCDKKKKQK